jgi:5-aminolevulinate synthase
MRIPVPLGSLSGTLLFRKSDLETGRHAVEQRASSIAPSRAIVNYTPVSQLDEAIIVPVIVGDAKLCKAAADRLLERHAIYIQPINYPTVPRGTEHLRFTPSPFHGAARDSQLTAALVETWDALRLKTTLHLQAFVDVIDGRS